MRYYDNDLNEKKLLGSLEVIVDRVNNYRDPDELKQIYKQFKKIVPFSRRSYAIGLILKTVVATGNFRARQEFPRSSEPRKPFDETIAETLFISIGRNRRVFARDIVGILTHAAGVDRDHIGAIRILDNYSFVQVFTAEAEGIIEKLNGYEYRGRKLAVSYSRKKSLDDDQLVDTETEEADYDGDDVIETKETTDSTEM